MTFSLAARCSKTGAFGVAITTASLAVGARCPFVRGGVGAVLTQNRTDPRLGPQGLDLLEKGASAQSTIDALVENGHVIGWRQLAAVDKHGRTAHYSGKSIVSKHCGFEGPQCVSIGNLLVSDKLPQRMVEGYMDKPEAPFADRLIDSLQAGLDAGGEINPVRSATVLVADQFDFPHINLRVDDHDDPVKEIRRIWRKYELEVDNFIVRVLDPNNAV
ncbi:hypothetical protein ASC80_12290 [Afipia sp. Root123D2]|uniref:DUF1028 domain-containing protein n=1 Tax=Afipia sp. Root123D2 TaxID=1736436 RepID=UPI0006F6022A|nr:DUF1028 domain-containing protein [Afipia sp. Root123D2]KQW20938.1 hypothetical protein ASC80_12290 [Afipia sp. Root123D2]